MFENIGVFGFILSILSIILHFGLIGVFIGILALTFSSIGISKTEKNSISYAGWIISIIGTSWSALFFLNTGM